MTRVHTRILLASLAVASIGLAATAQAETFNFRQGGLNQVIFQSEAPLETIIGTSNAVTGQVTVDLANPSSATGRIAIDASSFRTGIEHRDGDLAGENWLAATANPEIAFELTSVTVPEGTTLQPATPVQAQVSGNLTLRGVTQPVTTTAEVTYYVLDEATRQAGQMTGLTNNALRVEGQFDFAIADFGMSVPPVLNLKVAETITIQLRLTGIQE